MKALGLFTLVLMSVCAFCQDKKPFEKELGFDKPRWYMAGHVGQSFRILGSEDIRQGWCIGAIYAKPEPRFSNSWESGDIAYALYYTDTESTRNGIKGERSKGLGLVAMMHVHRMLTESWGYYYSLGWGLQYVDTTSIDLDSQLNSSPVFGVGVICFWGKQELRIGFDFLHLSNAGLQGSNQGQNQLYFSVGMRL